MPKKKKSAAKGAVKAPSIPTIIKRDGRIVPFDLEKIVSATWKGMNVVNEGFIEEARVVVYLFFLCLWSTARSWQYRKCIS
jgi:hypothetical protein